MQDFRRSLKSTKISASGSRQVSITRVSSIVSVCSTSPGLSAKRTFYGLYLYNEGQVRLWPYERGNGAHTVDVLGRLRAEFPKRKLVVLWDGVSYHRAGEVRQAATELDIECRRLPGYSPDFMPVEALAARGRHLPALPRQP